MDQTVLTANKSRTERELLDHLPCGASLFEYDGTRLSVIHINKKYWQLVGRASVDYSQASVFDMVHPEDRTLLRHELEAAIRQNRDLACDARILSGTAEYRPFHIMASIMQKDGGKYALFATYTPISEEVMSIQEMLPVALSTMMSTSGDYSFVKGKDRRYICCSRAVMEMNGLVTERDIIGKTDYDLFGKDVADQFASIDNKVMETGEALVNVAAKMYTQSGEERFVESSIYPIMNTTGQVIGEYGVSRDITEQKEKEANLERLINSIPGGLATYVFSPDSIQVTFCNNAFCALFGVTREECLRSTYNDAKQCVYEEDWAALAAQYNTMLETGETMNTSYRIHGQDGGLRWVHQICMVTGRRNDTVFANSTLLDITEQMKWAEQLRVSEEVNRLAIEHSGNIITRFDVQARTLTLPASFDPIFDLPPVLYNMPEEQITCGRVSPETANVYKELFESILRGSETGTATYQQSSTKGWRWLKANYTTVFSSSGQPVSAVISFSDITEQLIKEERSEIDPLTGVLNRSAFVMQMEQALQASKPEEMHALLMLDIDDFKNVNDTYGHAAGDQVLVELTNRISSILRRSDLVGRVGGDEFLVFIKGIPNQEIAARKAKQICTLNVCVSGTDSPVTVSIGIAVVPHNGTDFDALYKNADDALYKEKKLGKNGYCIAGA